MRDMTTDGVEEAVAAVHPYLSTPPPGTPAMTSVTSDPPGSAANITFTDKFDSRLLWYEDYIVGFFLIIVGEFVLVSACFCVYVLVYASLSLRASIFLCLDYVFFFCGGGLVRDLLPNELFVCVKVHFYAFVSVSFSVCPCLLFLSSCLLISVSHLFLCQCVC